MQQTVSILKDLDLSSLDIITTVKTFPLTTFKTSPGEGRWSAAEILDHILITEGLVNSVLKGKTRPTDIRNPEKKIEIIRIAFEDHSKKHRAGDSVMPANKSLDPQAGIEKFTKQRKLLEEIIKKEDMSLTCDDFKHFGFGYLTRVEWVYFNIFHGERHRVQIEKLDNQYNNLN